MAVRLIDSLATTGPLAELFSDASVLQAMLQFESTLARVEGRLGVIPRAAAQAIAAAGRSANLDAASIAAEAAQSGTPAIAFVRALTEHVRAKDTQAAGFIHWGATSQDVTDTALVLLLKKTQRIFDADLRRLERGLRRLSQQHRRTPMLGRTLLQPAPPVTFGLKAASWFAAVHRGHERLAAAFAECLVLQFGGASGTLAALGKDGPPIARALAAELGLGCPEAPWHTQRDRLAGLICACGVLAGSLGKMARDITLLSQNEIAEVSEPAGAGRGGSSTMPHKQNPVSSVLVSAAALRVPGQVAGYLSAMAQEHERGVGGSQAEWPLVVGVVENTGLAIACMAEVAEEMSVDAERMRANIAATRGIIFAERAAMLLAKKTGRDAAHSILKEASRRALAEKRGLSTVLAKMPEAAQHLKARELAELEDPERYLGAAEEFRRALLASAGPRRPSSRQKSKIPARKKKR
jgi:3-carboxy-cis,cis-muconate cycloisomerase